MRLNDAKIKQLTGGNLVRCSFKYSDHFNYKPQFKIWLVSNYDINADPNDDAVWGRIIRFSFPYSHLGREDKSLKACLSSKEALEGVLAWAVEGAMRWYEHGLTVPKSMEAEAAEVREDLDVVQAWLEEATQEGDAFLSNGTLYTSYEQWCKRHGVKPFGTVGLGRILVSKGYDRARTATQRGFLGLTLLEDR